MGIRHARREVLERLQFKTLESRFLTEIRDGLNCSPFEAEAVLEVVREVYFPYLDAAAPQAPPGKITLVAVQADEPAGKPIARCLKVTVCLSVHRGADDDRLMQEHGPAALRQARIAELCQEALSQGGLLTAEDLAYRVFFVTPRTISRDLKALRQADPQAVIPMRSTLHDMGPVLSHRAQVVDLALQGRTTSEICLIMRHSPRAVANYLSTFTRCVQLHRRGVEVSQIAFLVRRGPSLVRRYLDLLASSERDNNRRYHLDELLSLGTGRGEKKPSGRTLQWVASPTTSARSTGLCWPRR